MLILRVRTESTKLNYPSMVNDGLKVRTAPDDLPRPEHMSWLVDRIDREHGHFTYVGLDNVLRRVYVCCDGQITDNTEYHEQVLQQMFKDADIHQDSPLRAITLPETWENDIRHYRRVIEHYEALIRIGEYFLEHLAGDEDT